MRSHQYVTTSGRIYSKTLRRSLHSLLTLTKMTIKTTECYRKNTILTRFLIYTCVNHHKIDDVTVPKGLTISLLLLQHV